MKKSLLFCYGIICYFIFFGTFLYSIGFVGNLLVPKSIDAGNQWLCCSTLTEGNAIYSAIINVLLLSVFAIQHTIMARPAFKAWWTKIIPEAIERSTFVLLASAALLLIYMQWRPMTGIVWQLDTPILVWIATGVFWLGWLIVLLSTFMINHFHLFGLQQVLENFKGQDLSGLHFTKQYLYKFVRHPIMTGFIIAFWATPLMTTGHLLFAIVTTAYIVIAVRHLEEPDLEKQIGEAYTNYKKEVPMLIPFTKRKS